MAKVIFKRIEDSADIGDISITDGQFIVTKDGKIYIDYGVTRSEISGSGGAGTSVPIGTMTMFAGSTAPDGWLICDGSAISRTAYATLFTKIGTTYGTGDGSTTFNLPNFKGRVPVGYDSTQTEFDTLGETGGAKTHTLTTEEMPSHRHSFVGSTQNSSLSSGGTGTYIGAGSTNTSYAGGSNNITQPHNNLQPYSVTNVIIRALNTPTEESSVDSLPIGSILEYDGITAPDGYEEIADYSTNEIDTGMKWIDGKKIYRKVLSFTISSTLNSFVNVAHSISNVDIFLPNIDMAVLYNNNWYKCPNDLVIEMYTNATNFTYYNNSSALTSNPAIVILEYTKTTD